KNTPAATQEIACGALMQVPKQTPPSPRQHEIIQQKSKYLQAVSTVASSRMTLLIRCAIARAIVHVCF
ncbi:MAG: hypothetical protein ACK4JA_15425, partial [Parazoarcus communis]